MTAEDRICIVADEFAAAIGAAVASSTGKIELTAERLTLISANHGLTEAEMFVACTHAIGMRLKAMADRGGSIEAVAEFTEGLRQMARHWGHRQAEIEVLKVQPPWTQRLIVEMADLIIDNWSSGLVPIWEGRMTESAELILDMFEAAREGFIERACLLAGLTVKGGHA